ncbi:MAG: hypothetical protein AAFV86_02225 [Pseudomonadota bacterium]
MCAREVMAATVAAAATDPGGVRSGPRHTVGPDRAGAAASAAVAWRAARRVLPHV